MKTGCCATSALLLAVLLLGCASPQRRAQSDLEEGLCPSFIIFPGERSDSGRQRYGEATTEAELAAYRDRELSNCEARLASGDATALSVILEYGYLQKDPQRVVAAYIVYLETGNDVSELADASAKLYALYAEGQPGLPADPEAAFHYLGLAAKYNPEVYALPYADALNARGLYADAFPYYEMIQGWVPVSGAAGKAEQCEVNLKLADLYFRGRGVPENWYIGYYYWLQGLSMAADPEWGSCTKLTYYDRERFAYESERKRAINRRIQRFGSADINRVKDAVAAPDKGLPYLAGLEFRPPYPPVSDDPSAPVSSPGAAGVAPESVSLGAWAPWVPLSTDICQWDASLQTLSWSDVFQLRSEAIWSVKSKAGSTYSVGSAVAVSPSTLITNCHLINNPSTVMLLKVGQSIPAKVVAADRDGDRCILEVPALLPTYVAAGRQHSGLLVGEDVAAIGNPKGLNASLSRGLVAQKRNKNGHAYIQTDAAISSGSSGGGLFDTAGNLIGITTFKVSTGESLNFAIAIDEFCR